MIKQRPIKYLTIIIIASSLLYFNSCILIVFIDPAKRVESIPKDVINHGFDTGIIFHIGKKKALLIKNQVIIEIKSKYSMSIIKTVEMDWYTNYHIKLPPGEYIVYTHMIYLSKKIWKSVNVINVNDQYPIHFYFNHPKLVISKPIIKIR